MVETKAAKRKGAKKVARRASHELQTEVKRIEKAAAERKVAAGARGDLPFRGGLFDPLHLRLQLVRRAPRHLLRALALCGLGLHHPGASPAPLTLSSPPPLACYRRTRT